MFLMVSVNPHSPFFLIFRIFLLHNIAYELSVKMESHFVLQNTNKNNNELVPYLSVDGCVLFTYIGTSLQVYFVNTPRLYSDRATR